MGDGIQRKYALIINGDTEERHLENVDRAVRCLRAEDPRFNISVVSPDKPSESVDYYGNATTDELTKLLAGLHSDDDDLLVVYLTGHGGKGSSLEGCADLKDNCYSHKDFRDSLSSLQCRRIVVMDLCNGGGSISLFADPRTSVITLGAKDQTVSCQEFAPFFWSGNVPDRNKDGVITIGERYDYAVKTGKVSSFSQFFTPGRDISLTGKKAKLPAFEPKIIDVNNLKELKTQLKRLHADQMALVMFSQDWCDACKAYSPVFDGLASKYDGRFLMIRVNGKKEDDEDWSSYGISSYPAVFFFDSRGKKTRVVNKDNPISDLALAVSYSLEEQKEFFRQRLKSKDPAERMECIIGISSLGQVALEFVPDLIEACKDTNDDIKTAAENSLSKIALSSEESYNKLFSIFKEIAANGSADTKELIAHLSRTINQGMLEYIESMLLKELTVIDEASITKAMTNLQHAAKDASFKYKDLLVPLLSQFINVVFQKKTDPDIIGKLFTQYQAMFLDTDSTVVQLATDSFRFFIEHMPAEGELRSEILVFLSSHIISPLLENTGHKATRDTVLMHCFDLLGRENTIERSSVISIIEYIASHSNNKAKLLKDSLSPFLKSPKENVRKNAAEALCYLASKAPSQAGDIIKQLLSETDTEVRIKAMALLFMIGEENADIRSKLSVYFKSLIADPNPYIRRPALFLLASFGKPVDMLYASQPKVSKPWHIGASAMFVGDIEQGAGFGAGLDFGIRSQYHWSFDAHLAASYFPQEESTRFSLTVEPRYHFFKRPSAFKRVVIGERSISITEAPGSFDPYLALPGGGISYEINANDSNAVDTPFLTLMVSGLGLRWHLTEDISAELAVKAGVEIPLGETQESARGRYDIPLGVNLHF